MFFFRNHKDGFFHCLGDGTWAYYAARMILVLFFIAALLPPVVVYDGSTMRFFFIACVNLLAVIYELAWYVSRKARNGIVSRKNPLEWYWIPLLLFMGVSVFWAINVSEAILVFNRWFISFVAFVNLFVLLKRYPTLVSLFVYLSFGAAVLHVLYLLIPYYATGVHLNKHSVGYLNGFHGNKNIFAVFVLFLNAALIYVLFFGTKRWRIFASMVFFLTSMTILLLDARASFLSFTLQILVAFGFAVLRGWRSKKWKRAISGGVFIGILGFGGFFFGQGVKVFNHHVFCIPYAKEHNLPLNVGVQNVFSRVKTIGEPEGGARFRIWRNAYSVWKEYPLTGAGVGNFKIAVQKYESPQKGSFTTSDHAHNDFFEMGAELGYVGAVFYVFWILSVGIAAVVLICSKKTPKKALRWTLLGILLWIAYVIDAIFNFPSDRAEVQWMGTVSFAMVSLALWKTYGERKIKPRKHAVRYARLSVLGLLCACSVGMAGIHYRSSVLQRRIVGISKPENSRYTPEEWKEKLPCIPNIDENGRPLAIYIAKQYALHGDYRKAINELINDKTNPYYGMKENQLSGYYDKLQRIDSAIYWAEQCRMLKPLLFSNIRFLADSYLLQGDTLQAKKVLEDYLQKHAIQSMDEIGYRVDKQDKAKALLSISRIALQQGDTVAAVHYIQEARICNEKLKIPDDLKNFVVGRKTINKE